MVFGMRYVSPGASALESGLAYWNQIRTPCASTVHLRVRLDRVDTLARAVRLLQLSVLKIALLNVLYKASLASRHAYTLGTLVGKVANRCMCTGIRDMPSFSV